MGETKALMDVAMDITTNFSDDINEDLKESLTSLTDRMSAIANVVGYVANPDNIQEQGDAYVSKRSTNFGDEVGFAAHNVDINICIFFCSSSGTADVAMWIENSGSNGNSADIELKSAIKATGTSIREIDFRKVQSSDSSNSFNGNGYKLNMSSFVFERHSKYDATLTMTMTGEIFGTDNPETKAKIESLKLTMDLEQVSAEYDFEIRGANLTIDGQIDGKSGANFDGKMTLDGNNESNNKLKGKITQGDITIDGDMQVDLTFNEIEDWIQSSGSSVDINEQNGRNFKMSADVSQSGKTLSADMMMLRSTSKDTWTYDMSNISSVNGDQSITAKKLYIVVMGLQ
jgi:hypothetical protein